MLVNKHAVYLHIVNVLNTLSIMFEKLFQLVKNNAGTAVIDSPTIPAKYHEAVINEASSSIIEVLKAQVETGRIKDLVKYFQFPGIYNNSIVSSMVNKFANKLNNFYGVDPESALVVANQLIPPVMEQLVMQTKNEKNKDFSLGNLLSKLNGNQVDLNVLVSQMMVA